MLRLAIVDDHPVARRGLAAIVAEDGGMRVVASVAAPAALPDPAGCDVVLCDLYLDGDRPSVAAVRELSRVTRVLVVSAATLLIAMLILLTLSSRHDCRDPQRRDEVIGGSLWAGIKELWTRPFLRYMAILMLLGDGIGTLAYALMADYTKLHFPDRVARTSFYNDLDLATNLLGALLQLTLTRWLLVRFGAMWALVVPSVVNVLLLGMLALFGTGDISMFGLTVPLLAITLSGSRGFAYGMTKPATDALYTRVPRETRYKGKNFVETAIWRFGDVVVTSGVTLLNTLGVVASGMAAIGVGVAAAATWVAARAGRSPDLLPEQPAGQAATKTTRPIEA